MIVGEQIRIAGAIEGDEDLVVRGRVEGVVRIGGALTVEAGGWVSAEVAARDVIIHGTVRGNVSARDGIEIGRTGRMIGDATAPRVTIAAGAGFRGRVEMGDLSGAEEPPAPKVAVPAPPEQRAATHKPVAATQQALAASQQAATAPRQAVAAPQQAVAAPQQAVAAPQQAVAAPQQAVAAPQPARAASQQAGPRPIPPLARPRPVMKRRSEG